MTRAPLLLVALALAALVAGGCASGGDAAPAEGAPAEPVGDGLVMYWLGEETTTPTVEAILADFTAETGTPVALRTYANEAYKTAVQVALASPDPPDVFYNWAGDDTGKLVRAGQVLDLASYVRGQDWYAALAPPARQAFAFDGGVYGVPITLESKYFYYDRALFREAGLSEPVTFGDLLGLCRAVRQRGLAPLAPVAFGNSARWPGSHYLALLNQKLVPAEVRAADYALMAPPERLFTDPGYERAFASMLQMQDAGCFNDGANATSPEVAWALFYTGRTAMVYAGTWGVRIFDDNGMAGRYGLFRFPSVPGAPGDQDVVLAAPNGLEVSARTDQPQAAVALVQRFASESGQRRWVRETGRLPALPAAGDELDGPLAFVAGDVGRASGSVLWLDVELDAGVANVVLDEVQAVMGRMRTPEQAAARVRRQALRAQAVRRAAAPVAATASRTRR